MFGHLAILPHRFGRQTPVCRFVASGLTPLSPPPTPKKTQLSVTSCWHDTISLADTGPPCGYITPCVQGSAGIFHQFLILQSCCVSCMRFFFFFFRHTKQIVYATGVAGLSWAPVQPCPAKEVQLALGLGTVPCQTFWTLVVLGWQPNLLQRVCWNQRKKECHKVLHVLSCPSLDTPSHCLKCSQTLGANVITTWHNQSNMTNNGGPPVLQDGAESGSVSSGPRHRCSCPWVKPPLITKSYPHCNNKPSFSDIKLFLYKIWQSVNIYSIYSCRYNGPRTEASNFLSLWLRGWDALVQFTRCTTTTIVVRYHNTGGK